MVVSPGQSVRRVIGAPKPWVGKGFDTETFRGWAKLAATDDSHVWVDRGDYRTLFDWIVSQGPRLIAWNLRFDAEAVLKHLPRPDLERLLKLERWEKAPYRIEIVPWKMVRIQCRDRWTEIYDVAPFFGSSLDKAARKFLGKGKKKMDAARLNTHSDAWRNKTKILEYCQYDATLTHELADLVSHSYNQLGGSFHKPYSAAFVASDMLLRDTVVPKLSPQAVVPAESAFRGARFECVQRGRFRDLCAYDVKSAYPAELVKLEDARRSKWVVTRNPHRDALQAILEVEAHVLGDDYPVLAPLPVARPNRPTIYPVGKFRTHVTLATYRRFEDILTPIRCWNQIPSGEIIRPYAATVERLVRFREAADVLLGDSAKRAANSVYGKLLNVKTRREAVLDESGDTLASAMVLLDGRPHRLIRRRSPGLLYNPLHGGIVTEGTRLGIWDACRGIESKVVGIQADGILTDGPALGTGKAVKMGDLGFVARGDGISCGSGLYEIKGYARRTRGVTFNNLGGAKAGKAKRLKGPGWFSLLRGVRGEKVSFTDRRPVHLSESLRGGVWIDDWGLVRSFGLKDTNVWLPFRRELNVCLDQKRDWEKVGEARRLLRERFRSVPLRI